MLSVQCPRGLEGGQNPWEWNYRASVWVLGIEPGSHGRALNHQTSFLVPCFIFFVIQSCGP